VLNQNRSKVKGNTMPRKTKEDGPVCPFCNVQFEPGDTTVCIETGVMRFNCFWAQPLPPAGGPQSEPLTALQLQAWQTMIDEGFAERLGPDYQRIADALIAAGKCRPPRRRRSRSAK
jgi:hypothetical protein